MKKILTLVLVGAALTVAVSSCKSSKGGHCDAYGKLDTTVQSDLASK
ncbi:MAG: hypothetical protein V4638_10355 [Bacteroidota bacterium]